MNIDKLTNKELQTLIVKAQVKLKENQQEAVRTFKETKEYKDLVKECEAVNKEIKKLSRKKQKFDFAITLKITALPKKISYQTKQNSMAFNNTRLFVWKSEGIITNNTDLPKNKKKALEGVVQNLIEDLGYSELIPEEIIKPYSELNEKYQALIKKIESLNLSPESFNLNSPEPK